MRLLQALKQFPLATGGVSVRMVQPGEEFACSDEAAPGLIAEKLARPAGLGDEHPFGEPVTTGEVTVGNPAETTVEATGDQDDDDDDEAEKEAREPIENKDAGNPDGSSAGKRTRRARKGA